VYKYINICEINWKERSKKLKSRRSTLDCSAVEEEEEEEEEEEGGGGGGGGGGGDYYYYLVVIIVLHTHLQFII